MQQSVIALDTRIYVKNAEIVVLGQIEIDRIGYCSLCRLAQGLIEWAHCTIRELFISPACRAISRPFRKAIRQGMPVI